MVRWCFCGDVIVISLSRFCGCVVVFFGWCGGVFFFLCGGVVVFVQLCFCDGVLVYLLFS